ncbi:neuroligin 4-like [Agrilus planipennis]|uniref:Neuroligin 4-like n=1 Tax=Agrilus planipennis TaxID=224129 RepID=A0A7F5R6P2_AGRPL|nr:neuroligin 4-like [Agrilus planipennis]
MRNPNESPEADSSFGNRQEKGRLKNIEWTAYEAVHKKYLNLDTKPKLKNHYRAHRLSFWLNLVPDLHKPGGDDVPMAHHQLIDDDPPRPKLPNLNPRKLTTEASVIDTGKGATSPTNSSTLTSPVLDTTERVEELGGASTTPHPVEDGFAAYSTALSVTIAIGCSLLILNVLIFAGVYYQRDKSRMSEGARQPKKRNENGQMPNNICGDLESSILGY